MLIDEKIITIWKERNEKLIEWEKSNGIGKEEKWNRNKKEKKKETIKRGINKNSKKEKDTKFNRYKIEEDIEIYNYIKDQIGLEKINQSKQKDYIMGWCMFVLDKYIL